jgi:hypothetical protein
MSAAHSGVHRRFQPANGARQAPVLSRRNPQANIAKPSCRQLSFCSAIRRASVLERPGEVGGRPRSALTGALNTTH